MYRFGIRSQRRTAASVVGKQRLRAGGALRIARRLLAAGLIVMTLAPVYGIDLASAAPGVGRTAVQTAGAVRAWGFNGFGALGTGDFVRRLTPTPTQASSGIVQISAATLGDWTEALKSDGTVWGWGRNIEGQLADGTQTFQNKASPTQIAPNILTNITVIAASAGTGSALKADGTVYAWGDNTFGQVGQGTLGGHIDTPQAIRTDINGNPFTNIRTLAGGGGHLLALKNDGTVWGWGFNQFGGAGPYQCAPPPGICQHVPRPIQIVDANGPLTNVVAIAGGGGHSLAVKADGTVWAWGYNGFGQIGDGTAPPQFGNTDADKHVAGTTPTAITATAVAGGENWSMALLRDGTAKTWGFNDKGQLGDGLQEIIRPVGAPLLSGGAGAPPLGNITTIAAAS